MIFKVKEYKSKEEKKKEKVVEFSLEVDAQGDVFLWANGSRLLYIDEEQGRIMPWGLDEEVEGIAYASNGFPFVYGANEG